MPDCLDLPSRPARTRTSFRGMCPLPTLQLPLPISRTRCKNGSTSRDSASRAASDTSQTGTTRCRRSDVDNVIINAIPSDADVRSGHFLCFSGPLRVLCDRDTKHTFAHEQLHTLLQQASLPPSDLDGLLIGVSAHSFTCTILNRTKKNNRTVEQKFLTNSYHNHPARSVSVGSLVTPCSKLHEILSPSNRREQLREFTVNRT